MGHAAILCCFAFEHGGFRLNKFGRAAQCCGGKYLAHQFLLIILVFIIFE